MTKQPALEDRVAILEQEMASLKQRVGREADMRPGETWLDTMSGAFEGDSAFEEVLRLGREFRESQGRADEDE